MSAMSDLDADLRNLVGNPYIHTESVDKLKAEIERLRFLASGQDDPHSVALARAADEIELMRHALECVVLYWDEWKDAPADHPTALSLEEVVDMCRAHLGRKSDD